MNCLSALFVLLQGIHKHIRITDNVIVVERSSVQHVENILGAKTQRKKSRKSNVSEVLGFEVLSINSTFFMTD